MIFEATGDLRVFKDISEKKSPTASLIGAGGSRIIYNLLDAYNEINQDLKEHRINLEKKIIERTEELEKANIKLEKEMLEYEKISTKLQEINNEKTKYLLFATHQLKAPFAAIQSYVDIILDGYAGEANPRIKDVVIKIRERCELLSNVIKEMLELEKLKSRDPKYVSLKKLDLYSVLFSVVKKFEVISQNKNIKINLTAPDEAFYIEGNDKQIDILFSILLENAINYSQQNSFVEVIIKKMAENRVYVGVKDQGIGISQDNLNKIFGEFFRANNAVAYQKNGTGLGLAVAREIAIIHNTNIHVESVLNHGSCFSVDFKLI
jgi:signal transduction histidine kinase